MPITFTFYSFKDKQPSDGQDIVILRKRYAMGVECFDPVQCTSEYQWTHIDDEGCETGMSCVYNRDIEVASIGDVEPCGEGGFWKLICIADGMELTDNSYWTSHDEFCKSLPTNETED